VGSTAFRQRRWGSVVSSVLCSWALVALLGAAASRAQSPARLAADIPPQPLAEALAAYARQTGLQLVFVSEIARGKTSKGAPAGLTQEAALTQLLDGTGLRFEFLNERSVRILVAKPKLPPAPAPPHEEHRGGESITTVQEIVVTAAQRDELQNHVPISMGVWTPQSIEASGAKDFATLADLTPGVEFDAYPDYSAGIETNVAIRGVNSDDGSTTAIYIDDTPIPTDPASSFGREYPMLFDLERVEVLRGPQGVSFGEGAEGGAVRFITVQPSLTNYSGFANSEFSETARAAPSYEVGAAVGGPLTRDVLGFRLGAWLQRDGGFVDRVDPYTDTIVDKNANWVRNEAGNAAVTIAPSESLQITPSFRYQSTDVHDTSAFFLSLSDPARGVLRNGSGLTQYYSDRFTLISLKAAAALGPADLGSVTAYSQRHASALEDNATLDGLNQTGYANAKADPVWLDQTVLSQELRLASSDRTARLSWIVGASYVHAHYEESQDIANSALADGGALNGKQLVDRVRSQAGAYVEVDLRLQQRLTASVGARVERDSYDSFQQVEPISPLVGEQNFSISGAATPVTPRFNLAYQADANGLYYATVAKGYRMGGPNDTVGVACPVSTPLTYRPDLVWSYEIGAKNSLFDEHLQVDSGVFYIAWQDMQLPIPLTNCGLGFTVNAGTATSDGFDLGLQAALSGHLKLALTAAYTNAHYDETVTLNHLVVVARGDAIGALPLVTPPWSVTTSAAYEMAIAGARVTFSAQDAFHSRNPGPFASDNPMAVTYAPTRRANPSTNLLNLRAAAVWSDFELSLFVNNALDSQPTLQVRNHVSTDSLLYATTFRPRTIGVAGRWRF
jgi:iron complex outermembrane receptor protein